MTKNPSERKSTLTLALIAKQHIEAHPSVAENTGAPERTAQHHLCRIMNAANANAEYSLMFAASALLGGPPEPCTHNVGNLNVEAAMRLAIQHLKAIDKLELMQPTDLDENGGKMDVDGDEEEGDDTMDVDGGDNDKVEDDEQVLSSDGSVRQRRCSPQAYEGVLRAPHN